jgi:hypothetical protein
MIKKYDFVWSSGLLIMKSEFFIFVGRVIGVRSELLIKLEKKFYFEKKKFNKKNYIK